MDARSMGGSRIRASVIVLLLCSIMCLGGCALATNGRTQVIPVASEPPGATIYVDGSPAGSTPSVVEVARSSKSILIRLERDGYRPAEVALTRKPGAAAHLSLATACTGVIVGQLTAPEPWEEPEPVMYVALGVTIWGAFGMLVDYSSGAAYAHDPDRVFVVLDAADDPD